MAMKKAGIAELKNRLSYYLGFVRRGQSIVVYDRDRPIARIEPLGGTVLAEGEDWTADLLETGSLRVPQARLAKDWLRRRPKVHADVVSAVNAERESGW
jgi:antitoxin (DNA-binding transcriptional repressor) of toxin-antitoxin stability system